MASSWPSSRSILNPNAKEFIPASAWALPPSQEIMGLSLPKGPNTMQGGGRKPEAVYIPQDSTFPYLPYLDFQDLLNLRLTHPKFQQIVMKEEFQQRGILVVDFTKAIDYQVFRNLKLDIRVRGGGERISSDEVIKFLKEFDKRITDVDFSKLKNRWGISLIGKLTRHLKNLEKVVINDSENGSSALLEKNAASLKHLELSDVFNKQFNLKHSLPNVKILKLWKCSENVAIEVLEKVDNLRKILVSCQSDDIEAYMLHGYDVTKNLLRCIEDSSDTLEHLEMEWIDLDFRMRQWLGDSPLTKLKVLKANCCQGMIVSSLLRRSTATLTDLSLYAVDLVIFKDLIDVLDLLNLRYLKIDGTYSDEVMKHFIEGSSETLTHLTLANMSDSPSTLAIHTPLPNLKYIKIQRSGEALCVKSLIERSSSTLEDLFLLTVNSNLTLEKDLTNLKNLTIYNLGLEDNTFVKSVMSRSANLTNLTFENVHNIEVNLDISLPCLKQLKLLYCEHTTLQSANIYCKTNETSVVLKTYSSRTLYVKLCLPSITCVTINGRNVDVVDNSLFIIGQFVPRGTYQSRKSFCQHCEETSFSFREPVK